MTKRTAYTALLAAMLSATAMAHDEASAPINCGMCKQWNQPQKPFRIFGNAWYVGTKELSAILLTGPKGHILMDGALPQSAPLIAANIKEAGYDIEDVKLIVNSHPHFDHAGGIPALQRMSGAKVVASPASAKVLRDGAIGPDDPLYDPKHIDRLDQIGKVSIVRDRETLYIGTIAVTAHLTPGHTPGSTTWSFRACDESGCLTMVYADSLNPVSSDGFRFTGNGSQPDLTPLFRQSIRKVASLKCDIVVSVHPGLTNTMEKLAARTKDENPFIEYEGCRDYAADATKRLDKRIATELAEKARR
jgi:metallo-beta-lactamase class B